MNEWGLSYLLVIHKPTSAQSICLVLFASFLIFAGSHIQGPVCFPEASEWEVLTCSTQIWEGRAKGTNRATLCSTAHTQQWSYDNKEVVDREGRWWGSAMACYPLVRDVDLYWKKCVCVCKRRSTYSTLYCIQAFWKMAKVKFVAEQLACFNEGVLF